MGKIEVDLEKLDWGLFLRSELARCFRKQSELNDHFKERRQSIARDYYSSTFLDRKFSSEETTRGIELTHVVFHEDEISEQEEMFSQLRNYFQLPYAGRLIIGKSVDFEPEDLSQVQSAIDYSLVVQSFLFEPSVTLSSKVIDLFTDYFSRVRGIFGIKDEIHTLDQLNKFTGLSQDTVSESVSLTYFDILVKLKRRCWFVLGVDLINFMQRLVSSEYSQDLKFLSSEQEALALNVSGFRPLVDRWLQIWSASRVTGYLTDNIQQVRYRDLSLEKNELERSIRLLKEGNRSRFRKLTASYVGVATYLLGEIDSAIEKSNYRKVYENCVLLYELDEGILYHLDWTYLHNKVPPFAGVHSLERCVFELMFTHYPHPIQHGRLRWFRDIGSFMAELSIFVRQQRDQKRSHRQIINQIKLSLTDGAARYLTSSILKRVHLERLKNHFPPVAVSIETSRDNLDDEDLLTRLRLVLSDLALEKRLITQKQHSEIRADENSAVGVRVFQQHLDKGRVRLPWLAIKKRCREFTEETLSYFLINSIDPKDVRKSRELIETIVSGRCDDFLRRCVFDRSIGFDTILASNLRHGVILTVYASMFTKAIDDCGYESPFLATWDEASLTELFGEAYGIIDDLRTDTLQLLKQFMQTELTINPTDAFYCSLLDELITEIFNILADEQRSHPENYNKVYELLKGRFVQQVDLARGSFEKNVASEITKKVQDASVKVSKLKNGDTKYMDCLIGHHEKSEKKLLNWMNVVTDDSELSDFSVLDLIKSEAQMIYLQDMATMQIDVNCSVDGQKRPDIQFQGRFYELLNEVNHNLISNAFKHSGFGPQTSISIDYTKVGTDLIIVATNDLEYEAYLAAKQKLDFARDLANGNVEFNPGASEFTGFAKIRGAVQQIDDCAVEIDAQIETRYSRTYTVRVKISGVPILER